MDGVSWGRQIRETPGPTRRSSVSEVAIVKELWITRRLAFFIPDSDMLLVFKVKWDFSFQSG
jgi:hypothetical protein